MDKLLFGLPLPAIVGLLIELLKKAQLIKTGDHARIANIVLSALGALAISLMGEFSVELPQMVFIVVAAVYSIVASALGYTYIENKIVK
jgi:hypothetical protein